MILRKRMYGIALAMGIMAGAFSMTTPASADDITGTRLEMEMREMNRIGVMQGYSEGEFRPDEKVSRGQFAAFVSRALELPAGTGSFPDVPSTITLADSIYKAAAAGIVTGYSNGNFGTDDTITREQMAVMIDRALDYLKIEKERGAVEFTDVDQFTSSAFKLAVSYNVHFGIIQGFPNTDGTFSFRPKETATRAQAAAFIYRLLNVENNQPEEPGENETPPVELAFQIATIDANGQLVNKPTKYETFEQAETAMSTATNEVIVQGTKVVKMKAGIVATKAYSIMNNTNLDEIVGVASNSELKYLDADANQVKVQIADTIGYLSQDSVTLIPTQMLQGRSYYEVRDGELFHRIFNHTTAKYVEYKFGVAPSFLQEEQKYYSWNGDTFLTENGNVVGESYQYFNVLSIRSKSNYTAEELNSYVAANYPTSPLKDLGAVIKQAEADYHVNALYILSKAALESAWGESTIAKNYNNLFGIKVYDTDPSQGQKFESLAESITYFASYVSTKYLTPGGSFYYGAVGGDKHWGVNVKYASDPYSEQKVSGIMYRIDQALGQKDWMQYDIAEVANLDANYSLRARPDASTGQAEYYMYPSNGYPLTILEPTTGTQDGAQWYKILSDSPLHEFAYVHGDYVQVLPIAGDED